MKTKRALLLLMLLIAVGCGESERTANLTACPDCGEKVSKRAAACPHCGAPVAKESITNTIGMKLNLIPAGTFEIGSYRTRGHNVTITKAFYMQTTEVTQGQWNAVMGTDPWKGQQYDKEDPNHAASHISWNDAVAYCKKLSEIEGKTYRLPTEAEWEYACRAGTETRWSFGDDEKALGDYAWYEENAGFNYYPRQVGLKRPNAWGLYDMHGNVFEWCHDYYYHYYIQSPEKDPTGPASGDDYDRRALRGGSWNMPEYFARSRSRDYAARAEVRSQYFGFRLVRELD